MENLPVKYDVEEAVLAKFRGYKDLTIQGINDKGGLQLVHASRMEIKAFRGAVTKWHKEKKAGALEYGRKLDAEKNRLLNEVTPAEEHLAAEEKRITDEIDRIKREKAEAEAKRIEARMAAFHRAEGAITLTEARDWTDEEYYLHLGEAEVEKAERDKARAEAEAAREAEEARRQAAAKAEFERLKAEREALDAKRRADEAAARAEREKIEAERKAAQDKIDAENRRAAAERKKIEDERRAFEAEKKAEQDRKDREAALAKAEEEAERRERERIEREAREKQEREAAEKARREADEKHREDVLVDAARAIHGIIGGVSDGNAFRIVKAIEAGKIPRVKIEF